MTYDDVGGDEIGMAAMNVYGQPPHAQHVYLPSYYQGQMTYTRKFSLSQSTIINFCLHFLLFYYHFTFQIPVNIYLLLCCWSFYFDTTYRFSFCFLFAKSDRMQSVIYKARLIRFLECVVSLLFTSAVVHFE